MWPWIGFTIGVLAGLSTPVILPLAHALVLLVLMTLLIVLPRFRNGFVIEYRFVFIIFDVVNIEP